MPAKCERLEKNLKRDSCPPAFIYVLRCLGRGGKLDFLGRWPVWTDTFGLNSRRESRTL
jgi:hypothetical protein